MVSGNSATIDSVAKAGRYLSGLGGSIGFDEAIRRVSARSNAEVGDKLVRLARWVKGESSETPSPELSLIGNVVKHSFAGGDAEKSIGAANSALQEARELSDYLRSGISDGLGYAALLLVVAAGVSLIWLTSIAPSFAALFSEMASSLPPFTQTFIDLPWLIFSVIAGLGLLLAGMVIGARQLAMRIESIAPLGTVWLPSLIGPHATLLHDRWRALTMARAWMASGQDPVDAVLAAARVIEMTPEETSALMAEIRLASELGSATSELNYQARDSFSAYRGALEFRRVVGLRLIQVAIGLLVGVVLLAIYLPLFKMGAVV